MKCHSSDKEKNSANTTSTHTTTSFTAITSIFNVKLPVFKGLGNEDPDKFWFVVRAVWEVQGVIDDNIKKVTLVSTLQDCALTWYIKHSNDNPNAGITNIQAALNKEFSRLKSEVLALLFRFGTMAQVLYLMETHSSGKTLFKLSK